jgi:hypothetical protein
MIRHALVVALGLLVLTPIAALAQANAADMSWFAGGLGGLTFGTETSGAIAGQVGVKVAPGLFVIGEVGRMQNVMPKEVKDAVDDLESDLEFQLGVPVSLDISVPSTYGFGGLRWVQPRGKVAPFVEGGVGVGHISFKIEEATVLDVDVKDEVKDALGDDGSATKFLLALGGGVTARLGGSAALDVGYRYFRIFTEDPAINTSMVYVAVKFSR